MAKPPKITERQAEKITRAAHDMTELAARLCAGGFSGVGQPLMDIALSLKDQGRELFQQLDSIKGVK